MSKNNFYEDGEVQQEKKDAARLLMKDYVVNNADHVAEVLACIVPFFDECSYNGLLRAMSTVNTTIATVALEVIRDMDEYEPDDPRRRVLPCGSDDMRDAVFYLTKFFDIIGSFCDMLDKRGVPAIDMCRQAYFEYKARG